MEPEILILFGRELMPDNQIDWIGEARCDLAISLLAKFPDARLVISGGPTTGTISEAQALKSYIMEKAEVESRIDLEETGLTSIHQMVILKNNYLLPNNKFRVGLVTDEIHMPRLKIHAAHIFGEQFTLTEYAAEVRISGKYRTAVQEVEDKLLELTAKNPVLLGYPSGDDKTWLLYDEFYRRRKQELGVYLADINQEFVEYLKARK